VAELQLRDGSRGLFGRKHSDVLRALVDDAAQGGGAFAIPVRCEAARQARLPGFLPPLDAEEASRIASAAAERVAATVPDGVPPEPLPELPAPTACLIGCCTRAHSRCWRCGAGCATNRSLQSLRYCAHSTTMSPLQAQKQHSALLSRLPLRAALGARITSVSSNT